MHRIRNFFIASFFVISTFLVPASAHALDNFLDCTNLTNNCNNRSGCVQNHIGTNPDTGYSTVVNNVLTSMCIPYYTYDLCGTDSYSKAHITMGTVDSGNCQQKGEYCALVSSTKYKDHFAAFCVNDQMIPKALNSNNICTTSANCNVNQQCVFVSTVNLSTGIINGKDSSFSFQNDLNPLFTATRCMDTNLLPPELVDPKLGGTCGTNSSCTDSQICVQNTFDPEHYPQVCVDKTAAAITTNCDKAHVASQCNTGTQTNHVCMQIVSDLKNPYQCVDVTTLPGGPTAPTVKVCDTDADCKGIGSSADGTAGYCLYNPATKKNQCMPNSVVYTDAAATASCKIPGTSGCEAGDPTSICTYRPSATLAFMCIKGNSLGSGAGMAAYVPPPQLATAQDTNTRPAPVLEINIPDLSFTDKLVGHAAPGGQIFDVNYLATYINAVYKYGIGLCVLVATIMLMYSGFLYMTAGGNSKAATEATTGAKNAVAGLIILFCAYIFLYTINPNLTQLKSISIFAQQTDPYELKDDGESTPTLTEGQTNSITTQTGPFTPIDSKSPLIEQLIGALPDSIEACSPAAADYAATKLTALGICVRDKNCANTASAFMNYIKCTKVFEGSARYLPAVLSKSGWTTILIQKGQEQNLPLGVLWMNDGHVGVSLGNGKGQFDSGNGQHALNEINKITGGNCAKLNHKVANVDDCNSCAKIQAKKPIADVDVQSWYKNPTVTPITEKYSWKLIMVPPKYAQSTVPRGPCSVAGINIKDGVESTLCNALTNTWPPAKS